MRREFAFAMLALGLVASGVTACSSDDGGAGDGASGTGGQAGAAGSAGSAAGTAGSGAAGGADTTPSGGSAGSAATGLDCESGCAALTKAGCPNEKDQATCVQDCQDNILGSDTCATVAEAMMECIEDRATVSCDADGDTQIDGCDPELVAWGQCSACEPATTDTPCDTCHKQNCCAELEAVAGHDDVLDFGRCIDACDDDQLCAQGCTAQYPGITGAVTSLLTCGNQCASQCE